MRSSNNSEKLDALNKLNVLKEGGQLFLATVFGSALIFFSNIILARIFNPELFGSYRAIVGLFIFLPSLADLGASLSITKYTAEYTDSRANTIIRFFLALRACVFILLLVFLLAFNAEIATHVLGSPEQAPVVMAGIILFGIIYFDVFRFITLGRGNVQLYATTQFVKYGVAGVCSVVFGYLWGVPAAIGGWSIGWLASSLPNITYVVKNGLLKKTKQAAIDIKRMYVTYSVPAYFLAVPEFFNVGVIPLMSLFFSQRLIGYYAFAMIFYQAVILLPNALFQVLLPRFSRMSAQSIASEGGIALKKIYGMYSIIAIPSILLVHILTNPVIQIIDSQYLPGATTFKIMVSYGILLGYLIIYRSYVAGHAKMRKALVTVIIHLGSLLTISYYAISMVAD